MINILTTSFPITRGKQDGCHVPALPPQGESSHQAKASCHTEPKTTLVAFRRLSCGYKESAHLSLPVECTVSMVVMWYVMLV